MVKMVFKHILLIFILATPALGCPPSEHIHPCKCETDSYHLDTVICAGFDNEDSFQRAVYGCRYQPTLIRFIIEDSVLRYIPHDAFHDVQFKTLEIYRSSLESLSNGDLALEGLEKHLGSIKIVDCHFMMEWEWAKLRKLSNVVSLEITGSGLEYIDKDLGDMTFVNMYRFNFNDNKISSIHETAFTKFRKLLTLILSNNQITEVKRSMFPNPAVLLDTIDLSNNKIRTLPKDLFSGMPSLSFVSVANNKLLSLKEDTFAPVWEQLNGFNAKGNFFRCDCRLSWMLSKKYPRIFYLFCNEPFSLRGKNIKDLIRIDLFC